MKIYFIEYIENFGYIDFLILFIIVSIILCIYGELSYPKWERKIDKKEDLEPINFDDKGKE